MWQLNQQKTIKGLPLASAVGATKLVSFRNVLKSKQVSHRDFTKRSIHATRKYQSTKNVKLDDPD